MSAGEGEQYGPGHPFASPEHALASGRAFGSAVQAGLDVEAVMTAEGDYTPRFLIHLPDGATLTVVTPPPGGQPNTGPPS